MKRLQVPPQGNLTIKGFVRVFLSATFLLVFFLFVHTAWAGPDYGGTLQVAMETDSWGFDAIKSRGFAANAHVTGNLVMERLFELGPDNKLVPVLGLSAEPSADGMVWTVELRQGVKFHDGTPFNADAVVQHWQRILNPENRFRGRLMIKPVASVKKTGAYSVQFVLEHPWEPFLTAALARKQGFAALIPSPKAVENGTQNRSPVGTGPFIFEQWISGVRISLKKNPDYWQEGKPYMDSVVVRVIPDHEARYASLASGEVDLIVTDRPNHVNKLTKDSRFTKIVGDSSGAVILMMNTAKPPLNDVRVRRALAHAWDQEQYIKVSFQNIMPSAKHWLDSEYCTGDAGYQQHNEKLARELLDAYGKPIELEYLHSATLRGRETGTIVQQMFQKVGIRVKPVPLDFPAIRKRMINSDFDLASWRIGGDDELGPITMATLHSKGPLNYMHYQSEKVDELLSTQLRSMDPAARRQALCDIVRIVNESAPFLYLYRNIDFVFAQGKVKGLFVPRNDYVRLSEAWIEQ